MTETLSPCVNLCELDQNGEYCLGCGRSLDEIAAWGSASEEERRAILARLPEQLLRLTRQNQS